MHGVEMQMSLASKIAPVLSSYLARNIVAGALSSTFAIALSLSACAGGGADPLSNNNARALAAAAAGAPNLCAGQGANTFQCLDDTFFEHCTGGDAFVVQACPANLCATRTPSNGNPCIGRDRAREADGVEPPQPGQPATGDDLGGDQTGGGDTGVVIDNGNNNGGGDTGGAECVGGPRFDAAGDRNVGNGAGGQFIGGQCLSSADCGSGCCALPCGICSGPGAQLQAGKQGCGFGDGGDTGAGGQPDAGASTGGGTPGGGTPGGNVGGAGNQGNTDANGQCVGGPRFDPSGDKNVGNGTGKQFIGGQCLSESDCASGCCALPCGICSGPGAQFQAGKQGCGFGS